MRKKEQNTKKKTQNRGITLIALVITIIVLLILAGVSIATLTGQNGILTRANDATEKTVEETLKEEVKLKLTEKTTDENLGQAQELKNYLDKIEDANVEEIPTGDGYYVTRENAIVTVYDDGDIVIGKIDIWDGTSSEVPEIKEFEWYIYNCNQLKFFADCVNNGGVLTEEQKTMVAEKGYAQDISITEETIVYLMADLDLGARQEEGALTRGTAWTPIGKTSRFNGTFEGNNYSIRGVYVNQTENFAGFFGRAENLKNITIKNSYILGGSCMGGLVGGGYNIENCHNENTTVVMQEGEFYAIGGIAGQVNENIKNCTNTGTVIGKGIYATYGSRVGGIAGQTHSKYATIIENCINRGEIMGEGNEVGGIAGRLNSTTTINDCTNSGKVLGKGESSYVGGVAGHFGNKGEMNDCTNSGKVLGKGERVGGIVGNVNPETEINNCVNEGEITGESSYVGGVAGIIFGNVTNSYNKGKIVSTAEVVEGIGGVVGYIGRDYESNVTNCYNEGEVMAQSSVGGIIGGTSQTGTSGRIENNYNKGKVTGKNQVGGIIGRNSETFVVTKCYNKGIIEGETKVGSVIGEQMSTNSNISKLYYLNTLNIGAVNGNDITENDVIGVNEDINSYEDFLTWIASK